MLYIRIIIPKRLWISLVVHITRVYVLPEYEGKGYGTIIMDRLEEEIFQDNRLIKYRSLSDRKCLYTERATGDINVS